MKKGKYLNLPETAGKFEKEKCFLMLLKVEYFQ